jgi:hypothetical protein
MGLLPEAEPVEHGYGRSIVGVGYGRSPMLAERPEYVPEHALQCLCGEPTTLVVGGQGDAQLNLPGLVLPKMDAAVPGNLTVSQRFERQLQPGASGVRPETGLAGD